MIMAILIDNYDYDIVFFRFSKKKSNSFLAFKIDIEMICISQFVF